MSTPLRILIVDDEAPARNRLREVLADCAAELPLSVAGEAASGREALSWLEQHQADVALLDIHMPDMNGIELAQHMQKLPSPPAIVFSTAFDQHAIAAFEVNAVDYLLKPVRLARLLSALRKARAFAPGRLGALSLQPRINLSILERGRIILVPVADIVYLRAEQKYVTVRTSSREYLSEESLTHLEQEFGERFLRVHRNCLVAKSHIQGFERVKASQEAEDTGAGHGWEVLLKGLDEKLPVSRRHQHIVKKFRE